MTITLFRSPDARPFYVVAPCTLQGARREFFLYRTSGRYACGLLEVLDNDAYLAHSDSFGYPEVES